jgi:hypothetical protein
VLLGWDAPDSGFEPRREGPAHCYLLSRVGRAIHSLSYMRVPRTTLMRKLDWLRSWGLMPSLHLQDKALNSLIGMRRYQQIRRLLSKRAEELNVLDTLRG